MRNLKNLWLFGACIRRRQPVRPRASCAESSYVRFSHDGSAKVRPCYGCGREMTAEWSAAAPKIPKYYCRSMLRFGRNPPSTSRYIPELSIDVLKQGLHRVKELVAFLK